MGLFVQWRELVEPFCLMEELVEPFCSNGGNWLCHFVRIEEIGCAILFEWRKLVEPFCSNVGNWLSHFVRMEGTG